MKISLLTHPNDYTAFNAVFMEPVFGDFFDIKSFDPNVAYDKDHTLVVNGIFTDNTWSQFLKDQGYKFLIDNLSELPPRDAATNEFICHNVNWFWYSESMWYTYLGYNTYTPNKSYKKLALMPMRIAKPHRTDLYNALLPYLSTFLYSYVAKGISLPNDVDKTANNFQRNFNADWYDDTYFSVVSETYVSSKQMFVTEKTFKPMAFRHPFIIYGIPKTLTYLQSLGYETFENLFDESYDNVIENSQRLKIIVKNVENFKQTPYDSTTLGKLEHNHRKFFDLDLVRNKIIQEIIEPIYEYAESR